MELKDNMRQSRIKITVVIPVYNTAKYIKKCVESVLNQDYKNIEVILVNDGSSDGSGDICDNYALTEPRVKVINQSNHGAATARNNGINISTGDYVMFLDSDDFWAKNCLGSIVDELESNQCNTEVLFLRVAKYYSEEEITNFVGYDFKEYNRKKLLEYLSKQNKIAVSACLKVIKKELFDRGNIYFQNDLLAEDIDWFFNLVSAADLFSTYNGNFYYYRVQNNSASHETSEKRIADYIYILDKWVNYTKFEVDEDDKKHFYYMIGYEYEVLLATFYNFSLEIREKYYTSLESLFWLLDYRDGTRSRMIKVVKKILNFKITLKLLNLYLNKIH